MEAPQHSHPMIGKMHEPVAPVHGDEDHADRQPTRQESHRGQNRPGHRPADLGGERERECRGERDHKAGVQDRVEQVLAVATRHQGSLLGRMHPLDDQDEPEEGEADRTHHDEPQLAHRAHEVRSPPPLRPTDGDEGRGQGHDQTGGEVDPGRHRRAGPSETSARAVSSGERRGPDLRDYHARPLPAKHPGRVTRTTPLPTRLSSHRSSSHRRSRGSPCSRAPTCRRRPPSTCPIGRSRRP